MFMGPFVSAQEVLYMKQHYMYMLTGNRSSQVSHEPWLPNYETQSVTLRHIRSQVPVRPRPILPVIQRSNIGWQQDQRELYPTRKEVVNYNDNVSSKCNVLLCHSTLSSDSDSDRNVLRKDKLESNLNISTRECIEQQTNLSEMKKSFCCPQCKYSTDRKNNLKRHIITMHFDCDRKLECCGASFRSKAKLREHVILFHKDGYRCMTCGRTFCRKALLRRHMAVHSGKKDFLCRLCDYATSHKSNLERHQKVHQKSKGMEIGENVKIRSQRKVKRRNSDIVDGRANCRIYSLNKAVDTTCCSPTIDIKFDYQYEKGRVDEPKYHDVYSYDHQLVSSSTEIWKHPADEFGLTGERTRYDAHSTSDHIDYIGKLISYTDENLDSKDTNDIEAGCDKDENDNNIDSDYRNNNISETRKDDTIPNSEDICCFSVDCENVCEIAAETSIFCHAENKSNIDDEELKNSLKLEPSNIKESYCPKENNLVQENTDSRSVSVVLKIKHDRDKDTNKDSKRLCVLPYRCASCRLRFKSQADFQCHVCRDQDEISVIKADSSCSLVAKIVKFGHL